MTIRSRAEEEDNCDHNPSLDVSTLLPNEHAKCSPVWEYFGFRPDPRFDGEPLDEDVPTCRLCKKDIISRGRYQGML